MEFSAEGITSDYGFLLRLVNTFTIDTNEYYLVCYKVNDATTFKNLVYYFTLPNHHMYIADWLELGPLKLYWFSAVYYRVSLEGYQTICIRSFSFAKGQQAFKSTNQSAVYSSQDHPKRTSADMELRNYPKPKHYNYQTETAIFLATKHEKTIMACSFFFFNIPSFWTFGQQYSIKMKVLI